METDGHKRKLNTCVCTKSVEKKTKQQLAQVSFAPGIPTSFWQADSSQENVNSPKPTKYDNYTLCKPKTINPR
jgi:hypothetical protein